ncbi:MAG: hypothetical protein ACREPI_11770 [Candidatus Dormibacterales bacterium]
MFVRVVHRQGWDVEVVDRGETRNFGARREALSFAESLEPDWIEVGEVVAAVPGVPQHHRWTSLRRNAAGVYAESRLAWGGPGRGAAPRPGQA